MTTNKSIIFKSKWHQITKRVTNKSPVLAVLPFGRASKRWAKMWSHRRTDGSEMPMESGSEEMQHFRLPAASIILSMSRLSLLLVLSSIRALAVSFQLDETITTQLTLGQI